jgi:hypothetical protein
MTQPPVRCSTCGEEFIYDKSRTVAVGGGATPVAGDESEIMCPGCRAMTRLHEQNESVDDPGHQE